MSKVKITGNASGTGVFTIEAPGTNDPRTLILPDAAGTLLTSNGDGSSLTGVGGRCVYSGWDQAHKQTGVGGWEIPTLDHHYQTFDTDYCSAYSTTGIQCDKAGNYMVRLRVMMNTDSASADFQVRILVSGVDNGGYSWGISHASKWQTLSLIWVGALTTSDYVQGSAYVQAGTTYFVWHSGTANRYSAIDLIYLGN